MLKYSISILLIFVSFSIYSQGNNESEKETDPIYKDRYGIRVGIDLFYPIYSFVEEDKKGLEFVADYRITKRFYAATEFGYNDSSNHEDYFDYSTSGAYIKLGVDYNAYKNWLGMEDMVVVGFRYATSRFEQTLNNYTINSDPFLPPQTITESQNFNNLNAHWVEFILGLKVEVLHNVFLGFTFRGNKIISKKEPENFKNLYIPGFTKVFLNDNGFSFNYTVSYLIPLYKRDH